MIGPAERERLVALDERIAPIARQSGEILNQRWGLLLRAGNDKSHLARQVELMIVVGGRESANTRHLADVAREEGAETHHIESASEIERDWLRGREKVGVTAGASTPDEAIDAVVSRLRELESVDAGPAL